MHVGVTLCVPDADAVDDAVVVCVGETVGVIDDVGCVDAVFVAVPVYVGVCVLVPLGDGVEDGVVIALFDRDAVAVPVAVVEGVGVLDGVPDAVPVVEAETVDDGVVLEVRVLDGVGGGLQAATPETPMDEPDVSIDGEHDESRTMQPQSSQAVCAVLHVSADARRLPEAPALPCETAVVLVGGKATAYAFAAGAMVATATNKETTTNRREHCARRTALCRAASRPSNSSGASRPVGASASSMHPPSMGFSVLVMPLGDALDVPAAGTRGEPRAR